MRAYNFFVSGPTPKFTIFRSIWDEMLLIKHVSDFSIYRSVP